MRSLRKKEVFMKCDKILDLHQLSQKVWRAKSERKKVVHCHGVFDLLHIGHIRHFEQAKKMGDVLIVTVTPDRFVNKGPNKPVFNENLRAEAIAALEIVDYVAINKWPMAVETIRLLRPHFYVKGKEYSDTEKDHTKGIKPEEEAIISVGGKLVFTEDITFSSSNLLNHNFAVFPKEVREFLDKFSYKYRADDILYYLDKAKSMKVLVLGETIIDEYLYCSAIGKSSKEPTIAVQSLSSEKFAGGILAVGNHVASFCKEVGLLSFLGDKNSHEEFIKDKLKENIKNRLLIKKNSPTIIKRRYIDEYFFNKLFEVYEINSKTIDESENNEFCNILRDILPEYDVVVTVDFGHGMFTKEAIDILSKHSRFLAINTQSNAANTGYQTITKYPKADYICMNEGEVRMEMRNRDGDLEDIVLSLSERFNTKNIAITQGSYGCFCYNEKKGFIKIPSFAKDVKDRIGAGDAFLSITALCAAQNAPLEIIGFVGNAVSTQAVMTVGHRNFIEKVPLFKFIETLMK